ncbi:unnamed protein product [Phaedon cochleariae]|uniref:Glutathione peroxidase n=1 Tax=Phaedon cochleariae TaxID=80249 RepID=A0A9P0GU53_PHACE|nr:unnamed protein product [Phaedon cochleariae]
MLPRRSLRNKISEGNATNASSNSVQIEEHTESKLSANKGNSKRKIEVENKRISKDSKKQKLADQKSQKAKNGAEGSLKDDCSQDDGELLDEKWRNAKSIYEFSARDIYGKEVSMDTFKGHVCILVNVASKCGHTKSNYEQFVELYNKYSEDKGLRILAFPCNQFGKQEPGDSNKIQEFMKKRNVEFNIFEKIEVNGKNAHPMWKFMKSKIAGPKGDKIDWNFTKFIVDKEGNVVERHKSSVKPLQMIDILQKYW